MSDSSFNMSAVEYANAIKYTETNEAIGEVILTGGDPLTLTDQKLIVVLND